MTEVLNLSTGESRTYELPPEQAVVVAYEQSCGNWSKARVSTSGRTVSCGDWAAFTTKGCEWIAEMRREKREASDVHRV